MPRRTQSGLPIWPLLRWPPLLRTPEHRPGGLESALAYPQNPAAYGDPGLAERAAGYLFAVAKNHAFVDGNKRTAWTVMRLFVALNGGVLDYERLDAVRFVEGVAGGTIDYDGAREWIAARLTEGDPQD